VVEDFQTGFAEAMHKKNKKTDLTIFITDGCFGNITTTLQSKFVNKLQILSFIYQT